MSAVPCQPLVCHRPDDVIAHTARGPVTTGRFLADVARVAARLPAERHVLNACQDRYRFMVGLAAALVSERVSLLPSSHTPETIRQLREFAPDICVLGDGNEGSIDLPPMSYPDAEEAVEAVTTIPLIPEDRVVAYLFTSGSTGAPVAQRKTWGALWRSGRAEAERLGLAGHSIVATVPAQHSYGFESTVLLSLLGGCAAWAGRPFYPADIAAALAAVPAPRLLVTTPFHLRALLDAGVELPPLDLVLSATAPLSGALARSAEARTGAPLLEIYGCTESGQLASRRTTESPRWRLLPGVRLEQTGDTTFALGGHVEGRIPLGDVLELLDAEYFLLHGRSADLINIAGKRTSLAYLNHQLNAIPGVEDGAFYMPDEEAPDGITRLAAAVVAPGLGAGELLTALRQRLDAVFLPRPLLFVEELPRNATGKLTRDSLQALFGHLGRGNTP